MMKAKADFTAAALATIVCLTFLTMSSGHAVADKNPASGVVVALKVEGVKSPICVGELSGFRVSAIDSLGHVVQKYPGTVYFTSSDPRAVLPAPYKFVKSDGGSRFFNKDGVKFGTPGEQSLTATNSSNSKITGSQTGIRVVLYRIYLKEEFTSQSTLDSGWTFWKYPYSDYNWFTVSSGCLIATNAGGWSVDDAWNSLAEWHWASTIQNAGKVTIVIRIFLPFDYDYKEGFWGQPFYLNLYDGAGERVLFTRFVMDDWFMSGGAPSGWVVGLSTGWDQICTFNSGWHTVSLVITEGAST